MPRSKNFDRNSALDQAMSLFWANGFAATSTGELVKAMQIGRQSMYDSFGDKRALYLETLSRYHEQITTKLLLALETSTTAFAGIEAMLLVVAERDEAVRRKGCMSIGSILEFGSGDLGVANVRDHWRAKLLQALIDAVERAKGEGDVPPEVNAIGAAHFLSMALSGMQTDARAGAKTEALRAAAEFSLAALTHR